MTSLLHVCFARPLRPLCADVLPVSTTSRLGRVRKDLHYQGRMIRMELFTVDDLAQLPSSGPPTNVALMTSSACALGACGADFEWDTFYLRRWFGLRQSFVLRPATQDAISDIGKDPVLWAATVAAGNCKSSVPILVSDGGGTTSFDGAHHDSEDSRMRAVFRGYSAPGSEGLGCSVRFESASTATVSLAWGQY